MVDTRSLDQDLSKASYNSISAVINADYASRSGCDFNYLIPYLDEKTILKTNVASEWEWKGPKLRPSCYHPLLKSFRAGPWAKLLAVWEAAERGKYSEILYIDSDAIVTGNESLVDFFQDGRRNVIFGNSINESLAVFFSSDHWGRERPCSGVFLLRPFKGGADFVRNWWDFRAPDRDFIHPFEQDALWRSSDLSVTKDKEVYHFHPEFPSPKQYSVIEDASFSFQPHSSRWVCHVTGVDGPHRKEIMLHWLFKSNYTNAKFAHRIIELESNGLVRLLDTILIANLMSNRSKKENFLFNG